MCTRPTWPARSRTKRCTTAPCFRTALDSRTQHDQRLFQTYLEPVASSPGWFQVPEQQTPEQYGANIVKLTPVGRSGGQPHTITVNLDGYVNPGQANGVYATLVAD